MRAMIIVASSKSKANSNRSYQLSSLVEWEYSCSFNQNEMYVNVFIHFADEGSEAQSG